MRSYYQAHRIEPDNRLDPILSQVTKRIVFKALVTVPAMWLFLLIVLAAFGVTK